MAGVRESIVDHPGPYRLRLIAAGTADDIIGSLERVLSELQSYAPTLDDLNAGSALSDWDIQPQEQPNRKEATTMAELNVRSILQVIEPFAHMAEGRDGWDDSDITCLYPTMAQVRAARDLWHALQVEPKPVEVRPAGHVGRYIHLPTVDEVFAPPPGLQKREGVEVGCGSAACMLCYEPAPIPEPLVVTATRLADFAMKMTTGYTPDTGDPRRLAIYREVLAELQEAQASRPAAGVPVGLLASQIVEEVNRILPVDGWRIEQSDTDEAIAAVTDILRKNPPPADDEPSGRDALRFT